MNSRKFQSLESFFTCWFHHDWMHEAVYVIDVVRQFCAVSNSDVIRAVRNELNEFIELPVSETELERILLEQFHCYMTISPDSTARAWLQRIMHILDNHMG